MLGWFSLSSMILLDPLCTGGLAQASSFLFSIGSIHTSQIPILYVNFRALGKLLNSNLEKLKVAHALIMTRTINFLNSFGFLAHTTSLGIVTLSYCLLNNTINSFIHPKFACLKIKKKFINIIIGELTCFRNWDTPQKSVIFAELTSVCLLVCHVCHPRSSWVLPVRTMMMTI